MSRVRRRRHRQPGRPVETELSPPTANPLPAQHVAGAPGNWGANLDDIRERWQVIRKHARPDPHRHGKPMRCVPSGAELRGEVPRRSSPGNDGKVIYNTRDDAEAAIAELAVLSSYPLTSYQCARRTTHGHWHLSTDGHAARRSRNADRADAER